jgi:uncharacterized membrane protein
MQNVSIRPIFIGLAIVMPKKVDQSQQI